MKRSLLVLCLATTAMALATTAVHAQDGTAAAVTMNDWILVGLTLMGGAVGGVVFELLALQGNSELPHRPLPEEVEGGSGGKQDLALSKHRVDLGIVARILVGAVARLITLSVIPRVRERRHPSGGECSSMRLEGSETPSSYGRVRVQDPVCGAKDHHEQGQLTFIRTTTRSGRSVFPNTHRYTHD